MKNDLQSEFTVYGTHEIEEGLSYETLRDEGNTRRRIIDTQRRPVLRGTSVCLEVTSFNLLRLSEQVHLLSQESGITPIVIPSFPRRFFNDERLYPLLKKTIQDYVQTIARRVSEATSGKIVIEINDSLYTLIDNFLDLVKTNRNDALRGLGILFNTVFAGPKIVLIFPTQKCNLDCYYCDGHSPQSRKDPWYRKFMSNAEDFDYEYLKNNLGQMKEMGVEQISLVGGGDPTIYPHFYDSLKLIGKYGFLTNFSTNGIILRKEKMRDIIPVYDGAMTISISATTGESYAKIHPRKTMTDFMRLQKTLKEITDYRTEVQNPNLTFIFLFVITPDNYHEIRKAPEFAKDLGFDKIHFQLLHLQDYTDHLKLHPEIASQIKNDLSFAEQKSNEIGLEFMQQINIELEHYDEETGHYAESAFDTYGCLVGWHFSFLHRRGIASLCCGSKMLDTIYEKDFATLWESPLYMEYRLAARRWDTSAVCLNGPLIDTFCKSCDNINFQNEISKTLTKLLHGIESSYYLNHRD